jgi:hypothetical protein
MDAGSQDGDMSADAAAATPPQIAQLGNVKSFVPGATIQLVYHSIQLAGDVNVVIISVTNVPAQITVSDSVNGAYSVAVGPVANGSGPNGTTEYIYYKANIRGAPDNTNVVTATISPPAANIDLRIYELRGVTTLDAVGRNNGFRGNASVSITTAAPNELLLDGFANWGTGWASEAGSGFLVAQFIGGFADQDDYAIELAPGSFTDAPPMTQTGGWVAAIAAFR